MTTPLRPKKHLGQNFLRDPNTARRIVSGLEAGPKASVVEIGPGTGALTGLLLERFERLRVIEVDPRAADMLRAKWPELPVTEGDVLDTDWPKWAVEMGGPLSVIGNLPYYITSPILFSLLDAAAEGALAEAVIMMQHEVAARLVAEPRTKQYGILSVAVQLLCHAKILFPVSRNVFHPKPDVRSAVVRLVPRADGLSLEEACHVRKVVRTAFNQRRKTLRNSLKAMTGPDGTCIPEKWRGARAEELSPHDFVALAGYISGDR